MSSTASQHSAVSQLTYPQPLWRYLILFQSWGQFQSWTMIVLVTAVFIQGIMFLCGARLIPAKGILLGIAIGSLVSVLMVIPAQFTISPSSDESMRRLITQLKEMRYIETVQREIAQERTCVVYRQNLPRLLRWDEGDVTISLQPNLILICGAQAVLKRIRYQLVNCRLHEQ